MAHLYSQSRRSADFVCLNDMVETVTVKLNDGIEPGIGHFYTKIYILGINVIPGNLSNYLFLLFN
jgi:hypothetical protein